jgi:hypothetical protein
MLSRYNIALIDGLDDVSFHSPILPFFLCCNICPIWSAYLVCLPRPRPLAPFLVPRPAGVPVGLPPFEGLVLQILQSQFPVGAAVNPAQAIWNHSIGQSSFCTSAWACAAGGRQLTSHAIIWDISASSGRVEKETHLSVRDLVAVTVSRLVSACQPGSANRVDIRISISEFWRYDNRLGNCGSWNLPNSSTAPSTTTAPAPTSRSSSFPPCPTSPCSHCALLNIGQCPCITIF